MMKRLTLVGTLELPDEPPILLCTYGGSSTAAARAGLESKLQALIDGSFHPVSRGKATERLSPLMTLNEVLILWQCHRITILRLIRRGRLHPIGALDAMYFERAEVMKIGNRRIAVYPHLTLAKRPRPS